MLLQGLVLSSFHRCSLPVEVWLSVLLVAWLLFLRFNFLVIKQVNLVWLDSFLIIDYILSVRINVISLWWEVSITSTDGWSINDTWDSWIVLVCELICLHVWVLEHIWSGGLEVSEWIWLITLVYSLICRCCLLLWSDLQSIDFDAGVLV